MVVELRPYSVSHPPSKTPLAKASMFPPSRISQRMLEI
jgi:hypothetical protein